MFTQKIENKVQRIIRGVRQQGDEAICYYTRKFDGVEIKSSKLKIKPGEISVAKRTVDSKFWRAVKRAKRNIEQFQQKQKLLFTRPLTIRKRGLVLKEIYWPLESVGLYIPGGNFAYPSTVLMLAVPAKVAGVKKVVLVSPPPISSSTLAVAGMCGVTEIYRVGGAQAIAALAYGTKTIPRVDKIFGPGNIWVECAKKLVFGDVGIDLLAGPSEVVILTDSSANPEWVASDLLSQLEHGEGTRAMLVSTSERILKKVKSFLNSDKPQPLLIKATTFQRAVEIVNQMAPEHLEIFTREPDKIAKKITSAGAIFLGPYSPVTVGDYYAGPSHVLPTGGTARFFSGVSVQDFFHRQSVISYDKGTLRRSAKDIVRLAEAEGMQKHAKSIRVRLTSSGRR